MNDYSKYLAINSEVRFGKACIIGTRISVFDVLGWFASGMTLEDILDDYPELNKEQLQACLAYAANREHKLLVA
jgi:uncharacterized protein (DUF433 family)